MSLRVSRYSARPEPRRNGDDATVCGGWGSNADGPEVHLPAELDADGPEVHFTAEFGV